MLSIIYTTLTIIALIILTGILTIYTAQIQSLYIRAIDALAQPKRIKPTAMYEPKPAYSNAGFTPIAIDLDAMEAYYVD